MCLVSAVVARDFLCVRKRERKKAKEGGSAEGKSKLYYKTVAGEFLILFNQS